MTLLGRAGRNGSLRFLCGLYAFWRWRKPLQPMYSGIVNHLTTIQITRAWYAGNGTKATSKRPGLSSVPQDNAYSGLNRGGPHVLTSPSGRRIGVNDWESSTDMHMLLQNCIRAEGIMHRKRDQLESGECYAILYRPIGSTKSW